MPSDIRITVEGARELAEALRRFPDEAQRYLAQAGQEAGVEVIQTQGLASYPSAGPGNQPPTPYYIRGVGTQTSANRNLNNSERYGTQFYVQAEGYGTAIGNRASYGVWLADEELQSRRMAAIGWRKLIDVAHEKLDKLTGIYQGWIDKLIQDLGL